MKRLSAGLVLLLALTLTFTLTGCSQIAAVAPVGGDHLAEVRFATADVLVAEEVAILSGPDCTQSDDVVSCTGITVDSAAIAVTSTATTMTVTVGGKTIYDGGIQAALDTAARLAS